MQEKLHRRSTCRLCESGGLTQVLSLAPTPPANAFMHKDQLHQPQEKFPLDIFICNSCAHVQMLDVVNPEILFRHYVYVSGTSPVFVKHFENYANTLINRFGAGNLAVDIGSNDGTLLSFFKAGGFNVLGVDPAVNLAEEATSRGIETWAYFFTPENAQKIVEQKGKAKFVTANNVYAHIDDLKSVAIGVKNLLESKGVFSFEVSYLVDVFEKTLFDTIYHEHLSYHSIKPLVQFFESVGLQLFDAERIDTHGGSIRCYVSHAGDYKVSDNISKLVTYEKSIGLHSAETLKKYGDKINAIGAKLTEMLRVFKAEGKSIAAYGAPAKATTLMHHFGIDAALVDFVVDDSPLKIGLYTPGLHIPVISSTEMYERKPDYVVILAWNFADSIIRNHKRFSDSGGKFIIPLPAVMVV